MAATNPTLIHVTCSVCGAEYDVPPTMVGRSGPCAKCGATITVAPGEVKANMAASSIGAARVTGPSAESARQARSSDAITTAATPEWSSVDCRVCGTRLTGRVSQVGQAIACPDCGAKTRLPPPPPPKKKNIPAAMEGEQYELWEVDEAPLPSELAAREPKYIAIMCRMCQTLMQATENQVGQTIACPDCGTKHIVPPRATSRPKASVLARVTDTPEVDWSVDPGERPPVLSAEVQQRIVDEVKGPVSEFGDKLDSRGRAIPPRWPLVTGILSFPFYTGCRLRWAALTLGLLLPAGLLVDGIPAWVTWRGDAGGALGAMGGLAETLIGTVLLIVWLGAASNVFISIVSETSEGHDHISAWPPMNFIDSMSEILPVFVAIMFTAAPGWALGRLITSEPWQLALLTGISALLGFPVTLLSQLSGGSTFELIDLRVLGGLARCPFSTLLFYIESAMLGSVCAGATVVAAQYHIALPLALAPLYVGAAIIYARLVGRLGLRIADAMPALEDPPPE